MFDGVISTLCWTMSKQTLVFDSPSVLSIKNGYALLRSAMARALMDSGLMPTLGVFHRNYFNSFPLADDMMEPYRPFVDRSFKSLIIEGDQC